MGRCPVRTIFTEALELLAKNQDKLRYDITSLEPHKVFSKRQPKVGLIRGSFMFDKIMPLSSAVEGYDHFDKIIAQKIIFTP